MDYYKQSLCTERFPRLKGSRSAAVRVEIAIASRMCSDVTNLRSISRNRRLGRIIVK